MCWRRREIDPCRRLWLTRSNPAKFFSQAEFAGDAAGSANPGILGQISAGANTRCAARGSHPLNGQPGCTTSHQHAPRVCLWWQSSFKKPPFAPSRPCNEGGRGQQTRPASDHVRYLPVSTGQTFERRFLCRLPARQSGLVQQPDGSRLRAIHPFPLP